MEVSLFISFSMLYTCCILLIIPTLSFSDGNVTDRLALLAFKGKINQDPLRTLSSWNDSLHFCEWKGVTCGRRHSRVTILDLQSQRLVGTISPYIGNLTFLRVLNLANNSFSDKIPQQVGHLFRLKILVLSNNSLQGEIPNNISRCLKLTNIGLSFNKLVGRIPSELGYLSKLRLLYLFSNNLSGSIPSSLGNLSSLSFLYLGVNSLEGSIPGELGQLKSLIELSLAVNNLSGLVPPSLYNLSLARVFSLSVNQLQGRLPINIGQTLPNMQTFQFSRNNLTGPIPVSFSNCSELEDLQLSNNFFVGSVPNSFGNLQSLRILGLHWNNLGTGNEAYDDLSFITSLTNCSHFKILFLNDNNLGGMLPSSITNMSTKLLDLILGRNQIYGSIPTGIQNLVSLTRLGMDSNMLTGIIPAEIGKLQNLVVLYFSNNRLTGQIPSTLGNLTRLSQLYLSTNKLSGRIPSSLGNCRSLERLYLHQNKLSGTIPKEVIGLSSLSIVLDLSKNSLSGSLPLEIGNLKSLQQLGLSENKLSGKIPSTIGDCSSLEILEMEGNFFQGSIPPSLSFLKGLQWLLLSRNNLSGLIPKDFEKLSLLGLNLSFNNLDGEVPREGVFKNLTGLSVAGNSRLCGGIPQLKLPKCHNKESPMKQKKKKSFKGIILIAIGTSFLALILSSFLIFYWRKKKPSSTTNFDNQYLGLISYNELLKATDGLSSSNSLGVGSFGSVYKAILHQDEKPVAVKVLNLEQRGATKSFISECNALRNVRHRNLLKIITACSSTDFQGNDFKALVFELMPNGSLEDWLYPINAEDQPPLRNLSFEQRLSIAIDVASALDYLHHQCETPLVHRDLKPSNVLLDDDLTAHVGDFGLAKFLVKSSSSSGQNEQTNSAAIKGSIGYVAPEYGMGSEVSTRGDVYSYGILLLEMITGRRPTDDIFKDGLSLHIFCRTALSTDAILEIVDSRLLSEVVGGDASDETNHSSNVRNGSRDTRREKLPECLGSIVRIGLACSAELPVDRMSMDDVVVELRVLKDLFLEIETHGYKRMSY